MRSLPPYTRATLRGSRRGGGHSSTAAAQETPTLNAYTHAASPLPRAPRDLLAFPFDYRLPTTTTGTFLLNHSVFCMRIYRLVVAG